MNRERTYPIRIAILVFDGCMTSAVTGILDAIQIANRWALQCNVAVGPVFSPCVLAAAAGIVRGSSGFAIPAEALTSETQTDVAIVPPITGRVPETIAANRALIDWLRNAENVVASVCAGAFFLAEAGLLEGKRATTNPLYAELFRRSYTRVRLVPEARLIDDGRVLCAGSTTAFLDLAIHLIDRYAGHEIAVLTAKSLCMDKNRRSQLPYFLYVARKDHGDAAVLDLQTWLEQHHAKLVTSTELARRGGMSSRSLHRRFRTATGLAPLEYLHRIRIEAAKRLLETSDLSVDEITTQVGYADARSFSRLFRSLAGLSPRDYRKHFGAALSGWPANSAVG